MKTSLVVLCGGSGTRLWPLSRERFPKQFIDLVGTGSLFQDTIRRIDPSLIDQVTVVCNEDHRFRVADELAEIGIENPCILLEPVGRNTAPAIAAAAFAATATEDHVLIVLPSDHVIENTIEFNAKLRIAIEQAEAGRMVTFGVVPDKPETGFGYIESGDELATGVASVARFIEKPPLDEARQYVDGGKHFWNSGMFVFKASTYLAELERFEPEILAGCRQAFEKGQTDQQFRRLDSEDFAAVTSKSVDYAVMEQTDHACVIPIDVGWSDVGSWSALWSQLALDSNGNAVSGDVVLDSVSNSLIRGNKRLIAVAGVSDVIVVETADAVLVMDKNQSQKVKDLVAQLANESREELIDHQRVYRPWGFYEQVDDGEGFLVKQIEVYPGASLSLQLHHHRSEHWVVVEGTATVTRGEQTFELPAGESTFIPVETKHRLENKTREPVRIIEVQIGGLLSEDDIVRYQDMYGR